MQYTVQSKYIDRIICFSQNECVYYSKLFNIPEEKIKFCRLGIENIKTSSIENKEEKRILSCGRSNRDFEFLYDTLKKTDYNLDIISDGCKLKNTKNISIYNNIYGQQYYDMLAKSYIVVMPLKDKNISSGQFVILQAMQLGKPVICTESNTATDYIQNGVNGFMIEKSETKLLETINKLFNDSKLYQTISMQAKKYFEENYSIESLGKQVGNIFNCINRG